MKRCVSIFSACALLALVSIGAQEKTEYNFCPQHLTVAARGAALVMFWEDSPDAAGGYEVYRSKKIPTEAHFAEAELLGIALSGADGFAYEPRDTEAYYYFVLGRPQAGAPGQRVFISASNVTAEALRPLQKENIPLVTGIQAAVQGDVVVLTCDAPNALGRTVVYRGIRPLTGSADLLDAVLVAVIPAGQTYRDYPIPGIAYYYAVVPESDLSSGALKLELGVNATKVSVSVPVNGFRIGLGTNTIRYKPLPSLTLTREFQDTKLYGLENPSGQEIELDPYVAEAIRHIVKKYGSDEKPYKPGIVLYDEDKTPSGGGEEYAMRSIASEFFASGDYAEASRRFTSFLALPHDPLVSSRAYFYRGQCYAMLGRYKEAFFDFLSAKNARSLVPSVWVEYVLAQIKN